MIDRASDLFCGLMLLAHEKIIFIITCGVYSLSEGLDFYAEANYKSVPVNTSITYNKFLDRNGGGIIIKLLIETNTLYVLVTYFVEISSQNIIVHIGPEGSFAKMFINGNVYVLISMKKIRRGLSINSTTMTSLTLTTKAFQNYTSLYLHSMKYECIKCED